MELEFVHLLTLPLASSELCIKFFFYLITPWLLFGVRERGFVFMYFHFVLPTSSTLALKTLSALWKNLTGVLFWFHCGTFGALGENGWKLLVLFFFILFVFYRFFFRFFVLFLWVTNLSVRRNWSVMERRNSFSFFLSWRSLSFRYPKVIIKWRSESWWWWWWASPTHPTPLPSILYTPRFYINRSGGGGCGVLVSLFSLTLPLRLSCLFSTSQFRLSTDMFHQRFRPNCL
jgi:hypothetical protein